MTALAAPGLDVDELPLPASMSTPESPAEHRAWCRCCERSDALMRWTPDECGVYRPSDYDTPPYTPGSTR